MEIKSIGGQAYKSVYMQSRVNPADDDTYRVHIN